MEPLEEQKLTRLTKNPDRVSLGKMEAEKVERWLAQINQSSKGFLSLTKSDVVNFIVRQHRDELLSKELVNIRADHYDPIRHLNWIAPQLKAAIASGDMARVAELQTEIRAIEVSAISDPTTGRGIHSDSGGTPSKRKRPKSKTDANAMQDQAETGVRIEPAQRELSCE